MEKAIEVYELKTIFTGSVSAIIIGRLILGLADVIEQNNRAAFQFEEINRKLDIMMGKNNDEATESVDEASTDYAYPSVETDALNKRIGKREMYVVLGISVFIVALVIYLLVKG